MAEVKCEFNLSIDEFSKRVMFGGIEQSINKALENASKEIVKIGLNNIRSHLYPGHGYITGTLYNSYHGEYTIGNGTANITFGSELYYAPFVEFGTYKMAPRLHFRVGMKETEEDIDKIFTDAVEGAING